MHPELGHWDAGDPGDQGLMVVTGVRWSWVRKGSRGGEREEPQCRRTRTGRGKPGGHPADTDTLERRDVTDSLLAKITNRFLLKMTSGDNSSRVAGKLETR